jgi:putative ABC transport system permease protein
LLPHLSTIFDDMSGAHPRFEVIPYLSFRTAEQRPGLLALLGGTFLLLLISVVNAANLQIARATGRESEIAVRSALGAGGNRLLRMLLTESVLLSLAGGVVGLLLAESALSFTRHHYGTFVARLNESRIDLPVFLGCFALALLCGVVAGLVPGLRVFRVPPADALQRRGTESQRGGHRARLSYLLVITEIALSCVLLTSCGVFLHSFATLMRMPLGFDPQHAYSFIIFPKNPGAPLTQSIAADKAVLDRLAHVPGVTAAGIATTVPLSNFRMEFDSTARIAGESVPDKKDLPIVSLTAVSPGYFSALHIPLTAGRGLTDADREGQPLVAVANQAFVRNVLHNRSAVGKQVIVEKVTGFVTPIEIVGVSADVGRHASICCAELAISYQQVPLGAMTSRMMVGINSSFAVRTEGDVPLAASIREIVRTAAPDFALDEVVSLQDADNDSLKKVHVALTLASVLSGIALLLGAAGVYGLLAYLFGMRVREIGIRMALGAQRSQVLRGVLLLAAKLAVAGTAAGIALSLYAGRFLESMLFGVKPLDPVTFVSVFAVLIAVAVAAAIIPARRAASVDPMQALRSE